MLSWSDTDTPVVTIRLPGEFTVGRDAMVLMPRAGDHKGRLVRLVFAGRVGWMVADLMQQLRNAHYLDGKLVLFQDPTDGELTTLYQGAQFTLFPSFYEGWGLPVTESLAFGKPAIISNTCSRVTSALRKVP